MAYRHILVAVDLSPESKILIEKAASLARAANAKLSIIHADMSYSDLYTGLVDINIGNMQERLSQETHSALDELAQGAGYATSEVLSGNGDLAQVLTEAIERFDVDMVVCGHHQDFWSKLISSARQLINAVSCDVLIVPLRDDQQNMGDGAK